VSVFEYSLGWGAGMMLAPIVHQLTMNYRTSLLVMLASQLLMLIWLHFGVFESIRWLLGEGHINRAQIELQRACRMNRVRDGTKLAKQIAQMQQQQIRKASSVIEQSVSGKWVSQESQQPIETSVQELSMLGEALRKSFSIEAPIPEPAGKQTVLGPPIEGSLDTGVSLQQPSLSPTLTRKSFSLTDAGEIQNKHSKLSPHQREDQLEADSITNQDLIDLALEYSKSLQQQEEGKFYLSQIFHRKLYKITTLFIVISVISETSYYGLIQAQGFVGDDITTNYIIGGLGEWLAASIFIVALWAFSRRVALILPTILMALGCFGIALTYQLIPYSKLQLSINNQTHLPVPPAALAHEITLINSELTTKQDMIELRETINFWLLNVAKLAVSVTIQTTGFIAMETYPNNLRQSGSSAVLVVGRICSILAPFLINDHSDDKLVLKYTLFTISLLGILVATLIPFWVRDTKGKELCDRLNEIQDY